jgi:proline dehydrogenase
MSSTRARAERACSSTAPLGCAPFADHWLTGASASSRIIRCRISSLILGDSSPSKTVSFAVPGSTAPLDCRGSIGAVSTPVVPCPGNRKSYDRAVRAFLLWAARNRWLREHLPRLRFVRRAVRRFAPGESLSDALEAAERYRALGIGSVFTFLGENVTDLDAAVRDVEHYHGALGEAAERGLDTEISAKLTHFGLDIDPAFAKASLEGLADHAARLGTWVWVDMEGSAATEATIALYERARPGRENLGLCLQAYLRRTPSDIARLLPLRPAIRLVKGAYDEPARIAYRSRADVDAAFLAAGQQLLEGMRAGSVTRFIAGTHDVGLVERLSKAAETLGLDRRAVEVQMLYGIRTPEQRRLVAEGYDVRVLIAYGDAWFSWYLRRLAERPANVLFALRQLLP